MVNYTSSFSFYGSKSKISHLYPAPQFPLIIEPFAGSATYSVRHFSHDVWLNDLDEIVHKIWAFLISRDSLPCLRDLPSILPCGVKVSEVFKGRPEPLIRLLQAEANHGTQGARGIHDIVTPFGHQSSHRIRPRLLDLWEKVGHWHVTNQSYDTLPNQEATWFVDPPYNNEAGARYRHHEIDYADLATWCRSRKGHVIVCENEGAAWLPFVPLTRSRRGVHSSYQKSVRGEVVWTNQSE